MGGGKAKGNGKQKLVVPVQVASHDVSDTNGQAPAGGVAVVSAASCVCCNMAFVHISGGHDRLCSDCAKEWKASGEFVRMTYHDAKATGFYIQSDPEFSTASWRVNKMKAKAAHHVMAANLALMDFIHRRAAERRSAIETESANVA